MKKLLPLLFVFLIVIYLLIKIYPSKSLNFNFKEGPTVQFLFKAPNAKKGNPAFVDQKNWIFEPNKNAFYWEGPSSRYTLRIISEEDLSNMTQKTISKQYETKLITQCSKQETTLAGKQFIALKCQENYETPDPQNPSQIYRGTGYGRTHCLFPLSHNQYLAFITELESSGDITNNCERLRDLGFKNIKVNY